MIISSKSAFIFELDLKISTYSKILISLSLLVFVGFSWAQEKEDFSFHDTSKNFLTTEVFQVDSKNYDVSDFIFSLDFDREKIEEAEKRQLIKQLAEKSWKYKVKKGETLWTISRKFKVSLNDLLLVNNLTEKSIIKAGDEILIPGVKPQAVLATQVIKKFVGKYVSALTQIGNFVIPVSGYNWGEKHGYNATDIAANCGSPVYAADSGLVIQSLDGWNSGYGNYILIQHPGGVYTLYGHLSLRLVEKGERVEKGTLIGYVGNTGFTIGKTGCHLHFEVRGTTNPLVK